MRTRLLILLVVVAAIAGAAVLVVMFASDSIAPQRERSSTDIYSDGVGLIGALTATAEALGTSLDPTALASSSVVPIAGDVTPLAPVPTPTPRIPVLSTSGEALPGANMTVAITGAAPGESFQLLLNGQPLSSSHASDHSGAAVVEIELPNNLSAGNSNLTFAGQQSGTVSISISITVQEPQVNIRPEDIAGGSTVTLDATDFRPSETITVTIDGEAIGSAVSADDGSFSITTQVPDLPDGQHAVKFEGDAGSELTQQMEFKAALAGAGQGGAGAGSGKPDGTGSDAPAGGDAGIDSAGIPSRLYFAAGAFTAWLAVLTLWVIRIDRTRSVSGDKLLARLVTVLERRQTAQMQLRTPGSTDSGDRERAA